MRRKQIDPSTTLLGPRSGGEACQSLRPPPMAESVSPSGKDVGIRMLLAKAGGRGKLHGGRLGRSACDFEAGERSWQPKILPPPPRGLATPPEPRLTLKAAVVPLPEFRESPAGIRRSMTRNEKKIDGDQPTTPSVTDLLHLGMSAFANPAGIRTSTKPKSRLSKH